MASPRRRVETPAERRLREASAQLVAIRADIESASASESWQAVASLRLRESATWETVQAADDAVRAERTRAAPPRSLGEAAAALVDLVPRLPPEVFASVADAVRAREAEERGREPPALRVVATEAT